MASYHAARMYRLPHLGAVGPGYQADLVVLSDPEEVSVTAVYWRGRLVSGQGIKPLAEKKPVPGFLLDTVLSAQVSLHPSSQFGQAERLQNVIITTGPQTSHTIRLLNPGG